MASQERLCRCELRCRRRDGRCRIDARRLGLGSLDSSRRRSVFPDPPASAAQGDFKAAVGTRPFAFAFPPDTRLSWRQEPAPFLAPAPWHPWPTRHASISTPPRRTHKTLCPTGPRTFAHRRWPRRLGMGLQAPCRRGRASGSVDRQQRLAPCITRSFLEWAAFGIGVPWVAIGAYAAYETMESR